MSAPELQRPIEALLFVGDRWEAVLRIGPQEARCFLPRARGAGEAYREGGRHNPDPLCYRDVSKQIRDLIH